MMEQRDKIHPFSSRLVRLLTISLFITISGISYLVYLMVSTIMTDVTCTQRIHELDYTIERINGLVNIVELAAKNHDALIEENLGNPTMLDAKLREIVVENPKLMGVGLAFIEDYYPEVGRWCELYVTRDDHGTSVEQIGSAKHDYFKSQWFQKGLLADKTNGCWSDAYYDDSGAHALLTTFSLPIHDKSGKVIAVLGADVSLSEMQQHLKEVDDWNLANNWLNKEGDPDFIKRFLTNPGYSFILQSDGTYLVHPDTKRLMKGNFYKESVLTADSLDNKLADALQKGLRGYLGQNEDEDITLTIDGQEAYVFYGPVHHTGWSTVIVSPAIGIRIVGYIVGGMVVLVMLIGMIIALIVCHIVVRRATKPLKQLAHAAMETGDGHFDIELPSIKMHDEIRLLRDSFENMQHSLAKYIEQLKDTTASKAAMDSELRIANHIQMAMLPKVYPPYPERKDIDIFGMLTPAKAVGGDLFDFYLRDDKLFFCIGDVSGKGVPASLLMAVSRSLFRNISSYESSPEKIVSALNDAICENNDSSMFVTMFIGVLDLKSGHLRYCNAGHDAPMLIGRGVGTLPCIPNLPVGVIPDMKFVLQEDEIDRNTTIFLYTDGLNEAEDNTHAQFGMERIKALAESLLLQKQHQPERLINAMTDAVRQFVGDAERSDDLTMLAIQLKTTS